MAAINHIISLGIGSPAGVPEFLTVGLQIGEQSEITEYEAIGYVMIRYAQTFTVKNMQLNEQSDFTMAMTLQDNNGSYIDWTQYTIKSGLSDEPGDAPYLEDFVTGDANGTLTFFIAQSDIDTQINTNGRMDGSMVVTFDDGTNPRQRILKSRFIYSPGKSES